MRKGLKPAWARKMAKIDPEAAARLLAGSPLARQIVFYEEVQSTNLAAKALAADGAPDGTLVLCERQTAGRGRRGRSWQSEAGSSLCMSLLIRPEFPAAHAPRITPAAALGVCGALRSFGADAAIKWPNDVHAGARKLCGILSELGAEGGAHYIVCGIGVNVGQKSFPGELADIASSLLLETGCAPQREEVAAAIVRAIEPFFAACGDGAAYAELMEEYRRCSCTLGQAVTVTGPRGVFSGIAEDFDDAGQLLLRTEGGELLTIQAGDVSLRKKA